MNEVIPTVEEEREEKYFLGTPEELWWFARLSQDQLGAVKLK
jgi:hypothetical protein